MNGTRRFDLARTFLLALLALAVATATVLGLSPGTARADSAPLTPSDPSTPPTVTADGLPTVQQNGVVGRRPPSATPSTRPAASPRPVPRARRRARVRRPATTSSPT